jgi:hypothetical protein
MPPVGILTNSATRWTHDFTLLAGLLKENLQFSDFRDRFLAPRAFLYGTKTLNRPSATRPVVIETEDVAAISAEPNPTNHRRWHGGGQEAGSKP